MVDYLENLHLVERGHALRGLVVVHEHDLLPARAQQVEAAYRAHDLVGGVEHGVGAVAALEHNLAHVVEVVGEVEGDDVLLLDYPLENADPVGEQNYTDILPSIHLKYNVHKNANLRLSYGRSINRPGFFEIVPYTILNEDYDEKGNPDLRHTVADNIDLRYEFFPKSSEQFMVGLFWKNLKDPIEYGLLTLGADTYLQPTNFGDAMNYGVEVDVMKYFNWFGIKANYTYTHSAITTDKTVRGEDHQVYNIQQTRPLYGQAAHVANLSLLLNFQKIGLEGQVSGSYTGKRLSEVSRWYNDDIWEAGFFTLDASIEKSFRIGISIYAKATNLLNSPLLRFITPGPMTEGMNRERYQGGVVERREWNGQSVMIGLRYRFNMKNNL